MPDVERKVSEVFTVSFNEKELEAMVKQTARETLQLQLRGKPTTLTIIKNDINIEYDSGVFVECKVAFYLEEE